MPHNYWIIWTKKESSIPSLLYALLLWADKHVDDTVVAVLPLLIGQITLMIRITSECSFSSKWRNIPAVRTSWESCSICRGSAQGYIQDLATQVCHPLLYCPKYSSWVPSHWGSRYRLPFLPTGREKRKKKWMKELFFSFFPSLICRFQ